jgi:hypothetical protein
LILRGVFDFRRAELRLGARFAYLKKRLMGNPSVSLLSETHTHVSGLRIQICASVYVADGNGSAAVILPGKLKNP